MIIIVVSNYMYREPWHQWKFINIKKKVDSCIAGRRHATRWPTKRVQLVHMTALTPDLIRLRLLKTRDFDKRSGILPEFYPG